MRITRGTRSAAAVALLLAALAAPAASAIADENGDFVLPRDPSKAVPVELPPEPRADTDGFDWGDAGVGAGAGVAALLAAAAGAHVARGRHTARRSPLSASGN